MKNVKPGHSRPIVCLDAGHCGKYNRSPVVPDYYESTMVWKLHNLLATALEGYGIEVRKTRLSRDQDLSLSARGKASAGCDLFLSLHSNACGTEYVDRPEGIYLVDDDCGSIDAASQAIAALLAETVRQVMGTHDAAKVYSRLASGDRDGDGKRNDDYYGVLFAAHQVGTAGVILEHSFHTNARAAAWLLTTPNLEKLAKAEAAAIADYYGMTAPEKPAEPAQTVEKWYRVRKSWDDPASQLGAFKSLDNAKTACPADYTVYDWNGCPVYSKAQTKSKEQVAREVIAGKWGNGADRKRRLTAAGYNYDEIQALVNQLLR
jgi:N-acetylmuramoyl-L-alanine amidase